MDWTVQLKDYTKNKYGFEIIYPEKILRENEKGNYIYYKTDTHMTDYGNYIMYSDLIRIMSEDFPKLKITPLNQFNVYKRTLVRSGYRRTFDNGYNYLHSKIHNEALLTPKYVYYDYKYPNDIQIVENTHTNTKGNYRLLILGDSFQENLVYFLNTSFHNIEKYRTNIAKMGPKRNYEMEIEAYYKIIDEFKPDAILLIKNSKDIRTFLDMYPKEER